MQNPLCFGKSAWNPQLKVFSHGFSAEKTCGNRVHATPKKLCAHTLKLGTAFLLTVIPNICKSGDVRCYVIRTPII